MIYVKNWSRYFLLFSRVFLQILRVQSSWRHGKLHTLTPSFFVCLFVSGLYFILPYCVEDTLGWKRPLSCLKATLWAERDHFLIWRQYFGLKETTFSSKDDTVGWKRPLSRLKMILWVERDHFLIWRWYFGLKETTFSSAMFSETWTAR